MCIPYNCLKEVGQWSLATLRLLGRLNPRDVLEHLRANGFLTFKLTVEGDVVPVLFKLLATLFGDNASADHVVHKPIVVNIPLSLHLFKLRELCQEVICIGNIILVKQLLFVYPVGVLHVA